MAEAAPCPKVVRTRAVVRGAVQGVGFRPFIYRLASELGLNGWVGNSPQGVCIEVEGDPSHVGSFLLRLESEKPPRSFIQGLETCQLDAVGYNRFEIRSSELQGERTAVVLPDIAMCPDCLREIFDPGNRRYHYPFTNCTHCGPRYSIIEKLPYDRANTSMKGFVMCRECQSEYENPLDRRFHAQPNACPTCGPQLELWDGAGNVIGMAQSALRATAAALRRGMIVAIKGIGGFHLMVAAHNPEAVQRLRLRKHREEKPFAVMFPSLASVKEQCVVNDFEARVLCSSEAPIVLLRRRNSDSVQCKNPVVAAVAPGNAFLGALLPYAPLHHLLLAELDFAVVATSGNLSDDPICIDETEARERLGNIADYFLVHNRPIMRQVDDSIVRVMMGREMVLRRARGYAPLPVMLKRPSAAVLAVGAQLKNCVAVSVDRQVFVSQHIGDLENSEGLEAFRRVGEDLCQLYNVKPTALAADLHPDYQSTRFAHESGLPVLPVQHHLAHVASCMAENELDSPLLGICWDGTGFGPDATVWGGEFFHLTGEVAQRVGFFGPFRLPGSEKAVREPRRVALGMLHAVFGSGAFEMESLAPLRAFSASELATLRTMLERGVNSPLTSSAGRLFDGVASLIGLRQNIRFEGQAAMELESVAEGGEMNPYYTFEIETRKPELALVVNWHPMVRQIVQDIVAKTPVGIISAKFHNTLVEVIATMAGRIQEPKVVLTGGCFQNCWLLQKAVLRLRKEGFFPYWHQRIPPNDGGIALGQIMAVSAKLRVVV